MLKATTKKLGLMLIVVILFSTICNIIKATFSGSLELTPSFVEANKSDEIAIEVRLICDYVDGEETLVGMQINYDKSILEYEGTESVPDQMLDTRFESEGFIFCNGPVKNGKTSNLFKVIFKVKDVEKLPDTTEINFENISATDKKPEGSTSVLSSKSVTVSFIKPTAKPTIEPTIEPTVEPTIEPTEEPTAEPTIEPTVKPTVKPTTDPTIKPTVEPRDVPTIEPDKSIVEESKIERNEDDNKQPEIQLVNTEPNDKKEYRQLNTGENRSRKSQLIALILLIVLVIIILYIKKKIDGNTD